MSPYSVTKLGKGTTITGVLCLVCVHFDQQRNSHAKPQQTLVIWYYFLIVDYNKKEKLLNFWIVKNPTFLTNLGYKEIINDIPKNSIAIVSTEKTFITWLKLRLNNVIIGNFNMSKENNISPLRSI